MIKSPFDCSAIQPTVIKDLIFNEIDLLTEDTNEETSLYMISLIAQLKDN